MSGEYDYLLRVVLADTADFERLHSQHLTALPNVARVHSSFALRTVQKSREFARPSAPMTGPIRSVASRNAGRRFGAPFRPSASESVRS